MNVKHQCLGAILCMLHDKSMHISLTGIQYILSMQCCSGHNFLSQVLAKFMFSAITFYSAIETCLIFLY